MILHVIVATSFFFGLGVILDGFLQRRHRRDLELPHDRMRKAFDRNQQGRQK